MAFIEATKLIPSGAYLPSGIGNWVIVSGDGNTALICAEGDNGGIGAVWVYVKTGGYTWSQQAKLTPSGASGLPHFGVSAALSYDGNTALIGGDTDNSNKGAAWVFVRSGTTWSQQGSKLVGTGGSSTDGQGMSVGLSGDGNVALVGGPGSGKVWYYTRSGSTWTPHSYYTPNDAVGNAGFGWSISISNDGNTAIIGGYNDNSGHGAFWTFTRSLGFYGQQGTKVTPTGGVGSSYFGWDVSLSSDGTTAVIGGYKDNSSAGAAWIFSNSGGGFTQVGSKLTPTDNTGNAGFGYAVSISSDNHTVLIGGYTDNGNVGACWRFGYDGSSWSQINLKSVPNDVIGSSPYFGIAVALCPDGKTGFIGASNDNSNNGAVWLFFQGTLCTQTGNARIQATAPVKTQSGLARIQVTPPTKTLTGLARIQTTAPVKTQVGVARIQTTASVKTIQGVGRIHITAPTKTQSGVSRIQNTRTTTQTAHAAIRRTTTQTQTAVSRLQTTVTQTQTGNAFIVHTGTTVQVTTGLARIQKTTPEKDITGNARFQISNTKTIPASSRIQPTKTKTQSGRSRLQNTPIQTISGTANLLHWNAKVQGITGVANIQSTTVQTQAGTARLAQPISFSRRFCFFDEGDIRSTTPNWSFFDSVDAIDITRTKNQLGRAAIQNTAVPKTIHANARIQVTVLRNVLAKTRIQATTAQTLLGTARVTALKTITGTSRIRKSVTQSITGTAHITNRIFCTGAGSTAKSSSGNVIPGLPSAWQPNDIHICLVAEKDGNTVTMPVGWTSLGSSGVFNSTIQGTVFWRRAQAGDTAPTVTHIGGSYIVAQIIGYRNCSTSAAPSFPYGYGWGGDTATRNVSGAATTSSPSNNDVVVLVGCMNVATTFSTYTCYDSALGTPTERIDAPNTANYPSLCIADIAVPTTGTDVVYLRAQAANTGDSVGVAITLEPQIIGTVHNQTGRAFINKKTTQTLIGGAFINQQTAKTITGTAAIVNTTVQTTSGVSRIQVTAPLKTQIGNGRIQVSTLVAQTGRATISNRTTQTTSGTARIIGTTRHDQYGCATILQTYTTERFIASFGSIQRTTQQDFSGTASIRTATQQDTAAFARIQIRSARTQIGRAAIQKTTTTTQSGRAAVRKPTTQTITAASRVRVSSTQSINGSARIQNTRLRSETGTARIQVTTQKANAGLARITATATHTSTGKARLQVTTLKNQTGKASIAHSNIQSITGRAAIRHTTQRNQIGNTSIRNTAAAKTIICNTRIQTHGVVETQTGAARIELPTLQNQSGRARITASTTRNTIGTCRIEVKGTLQTQLAVSRLQHPGHLQTAIGNARIQKTSPIKTFIGKTRITVASNEFDITGCSRIQQKRQYTITGASRIEQTVTHIITGNTRIQKTAGTKNITATSRIQITHTQDQTGNARLQNTAVQITNALTRIQRTRLYSIQGTSLISSRVNHTIQGVARVQSIAAASIDGKARLQHSNVEHSIYGRTRIKQGRFVHIIRGTARIVRPTPRPRTAFVVMPDATFVVPLGDASINSHVTTAKPRYTSDEFEYSVTYAKWFARFNDGDTISSVQWTVPVDMNITDQNHTDAVAWVAVSGGVPGQTYTLSCKMTSTKGRVKEYQFAVPIEVE